VSTVGFGFSPLPNCLHCATHYTLAVVYSSKRNFS
jgi:hypothetical protein